MNDERKALRIRLLQLGGAISACWEKSTVGVFDQERAERAVDEATGAILAAGYRKPRQVTTVEELDTLPVGSVTLSDNGAVGEKVFDGPVRGWRMTGDGAHHEAPALPATVLHIGDTND